MENEKIAALVLALMVAGILSAYLALQNWDDISKNIAEELDQIDDNDLVEMHYILRYSDNSTVISSSYESVESKTGGDPYKFFVSSNKSATPPQGYGNFTNTFEGYFVEKFVEGVKGLAIGQSKTIGPLSGEEAFGEAPEVGDEIRFFDPSSGKNITIIITDIEDNYQMPDEYIPYYGDIKTLNLDLRYIVYEKGDVLTTQNAWPDSTLITKVNETRFWYYITPPDDKMDNLTWIDISTGAQFPANATYVKNINESTIVVEHNVSVGDIIKVPGYSNNYNYEVVSFTNTTITANYSANNQTDTETFDKVVTIQRNQSQSLTQTMLREDLESIVNQIKFSGTDVEVPFSFHPLAGKKVELFVKIVDIEKN